MLTVVAFEFLVFARSRLGRGELLGAVWAGEASSAQALAELAYPRHRVQVQSRASYEVERGETNPAADEDDGA